MITIHIDNSRIQSSFDELIRRLKDTSPLMQRVSHTMWVSVLENFEQGGRPTWVRKWDGSRSKLQGIGRLKSSITKTFDVHTAAVGTNVIYGPIHHFGGDIQPRKAKALAFNGRVVKKVTMPARPFLSLTDNDMDAIGEVVQDYLSTIID